MNSDDATEESDLLLVPDTSVIIDGRVSARIEGGEFKGSTVIVPEAVVSELENQANQGREVGFSGLAELKKLSLMAKEGDIKLKFTGERPTLEQIKLASGGEIDSMIRDIAAENDAMFITSDFVQSEVAEAKGLDVVYLPPEKEEPTRMEILSFFSKKTMSVHLKEGAPPMAKRGKIGKMKLVKVRDGYLTERGLKEMSHELVERAKRDANGFIEIEKRGAVVLQLGSIRIAITRPPFSDGIEITAVRPVANVKLEDYKLSEELKDRMVKRQRGVLIAGPPGAGKSTFAACVADFLSDRYVVKTMESPRDLQVSSAITQYTALEGSMDNTANILLLVRPDYTIYDEMRRSSDFRIFADMRSSGVGMIGVVHSTKAIDALQRIIWRLDLGMIPQVVDTVIFIDAGKVEKVYDLKFTVKVPSGMYEADLARPVIDVLDFETREIEYEIYTYGEQVVIMPPVDSKKPPTWQLAERWIEKEMERYVVNFQVEMLSDQRARIHVKKSDMPKIIGKGGKTVERMEKRLGISLDIKAF
ncbi:MAG: PINc/VapC family ATPase [Halobacteriota archaeon]|nr:PINc/VapC family ATPase [Halobacteriota archaeon]